MYLLAFESSCDDTSVALLRDDVLISMHTHTQLEHIQTLGVVPEVAARLHADHIFELITKVLIDGSIELNQIDVFAATSEPGLVPSLLIGKTVAKTLATSHKKPLIWVNHIEGHIFSLLLERKLEELVFPIVVLSASGGHNDLFLWDSLYEITKIGGTVDDSAGESMDKVGRSLGLSFPAGRQIDELSQKYTPSLHKNIPSFPLVLPEGNLNFSFSGLKSAALREIELRIKDHSELTETDLIEISYGYQKIITEILAKRLIEAQKKTGTKSIGLVGGVSANSALRQIMEEYSRENDTPYYTPKSLKYCGDNAAMIGMRAYWEFRKSE
ncbi:tRNA (adenosine(37)-N6)-threonylcarbamoyltransferase complex transferase subunit TsaD [Candidatus Gracilibacteria bacterium]|nr:tRNA (adenosine(37)-N6)-threonylcarbamoyltransferase complex transferase subunit TsaD [Candidatus Gracilibacteria bacterium]